MFGAQHSRAQTYPQALLQLATPPHAHTPAGMVHAASTGSPAGGLLASYPSHASHHSYASLSSGGLVSHPSSHLYYGGPHHHHSLHHHHHHSNLHHNHHRHPSLGMGIMQSAYLVHSLDGNKVYHGKPSPFGAQIKTGDTIGVFYNVACNTISISLNRKYQGIAFTELPEQEDLLRLKLAARLSRTRHAPRGMPHHHLAMQAGNASCIQAGHASSMHHAAALPQSGRSPRSSGSNTEGLFTARGLDMRDEWGHTFQEDEDDEDGLVGAEADWEGPDWYDPHAAPPLVPVIGAWYCQLCSERTALPLSGCYSTVWPAQCAHRCCKEPVLRSKLNVGAPLPIGAAVPTKSGVVPSRRQCVCAPAATTAGLVPLLPSANSTHTPLESVQPAGIDSGGAELRVLMDGFKKNLDSLLVKEEQMHNPRGRAPWRFKSGMHALHYAAAVNNVDAVRAVLQQAGPQVGWWWGRGSCWAFIAGWSLSFFVLSLWNHHQLTLACFMPGFGSLSPRRSNLATFQHSDQHAAGCSRMYVMRP